MEDFIAMDGNLTGNMSDATPGEYDELTGKHPAVIFIASAILSATIVVSILGNLTVIMAVYFSKELSSKPSNLYIVNLAVIDMTSASLVMTSSVVTLSSDVRVVTSYWCELSCGVNYLCIIVSMMTLMFVAVDRFMAVYDPIKYEVMVNQAYVLVLIAVTWVQGLAFAAPPVIKRWVRYDYWESVCAIDWYIDKGTDIYVIVAFIACFVVPGSVILVCYVGIVKIARKYLRKVYPENDQRLAVTDCEFSIRERFQPNLLDPKFLMPPSSSGSIPKSNTNALVTVLHRSRIITAERNKRLCFMSKENVRKTWQTITSLLVVVIVFFICMTPFCVTKLRKVIGNDPRKGDGYENLVASLLAYLSSSVNPFIYGIMRKSFRNAYRRLYFKIKAKCGG